MILSFSQTINGKPNYFIEKIWWGLAHHFPFREDDWFLDYEEAFKNKFGIEWPVTPNFVIPNEKLHTIREYRKTKTGARADKQWKAGDDIHPAINPRSPNYFQFAPVIKCVSVQKIEIKYTVSSSEQTPLIYIGIESMKTPGYMLCLDTYNPTLKLSSFGLIEKLAVNDGFDDIDGFFNYFNKNFTGVIIHWTDLKY